MLCFLYAKISHKIKKTNVFHFREEKKILCLVKDMEMVIENLVAIWKETKKASQ